MRPEFSATHMRGLPLFAAGRRIATRIQLQQPYHGLVESDVIIVNTKLGRTGAETEECVRRIASMLSRVRARPAGGTNCSSATPRILRARNARLC